MFVRVETFSEVSGRRTGRGYHIDDVNIHLAEFGISSQRLDEDGGEYEPFASACDYALAQWFHEEKITKGGRDRFFRDIRLKPIHDLLGYKNTSALTEMQDGIPFGIDEDEWIKQTFTVRSKFEGAESKEYNIIYRDITKTLKFLLGHRAFNDEMVFEPVREYNDSNKRVYTEMHTGDWWWETQEKLPEGATVVPILLSTDKTALTRHRGDLAAWPVYITIGNLKVTVRRNQRRPGMVLLGLLPIVPNDGEYIKSHVWHHSMYCPVPYLFYPYCTVGGIMPGSNAISSYIVVQSPKSPSARCKEHLPTRSQRGIHCDKTR